MYSVQIETSDGTLSVINLGIEYFEKNDISLYRNDTNTALVLDVDWRWSSDTAVYLLLGPEPAGNKIIILRNTDVDRAFNVYDGGAPFSRETLDENFRQLVYLAQEYTEGSGIAGMYRTLDMHGNSIINLATPVLAADATNKQYVDTNDDEQRVRIDSLENSVITGTSSYPWYTKVVVATDTLTPPIPFDKASVYINGVCQIPSYSYIVVDNTILLAEPLVTGDLVFARLGEDTDSTTGFATTDALTAYVALLQAAIDGLGVSKANSGVNSDITSITGLTTPLSISQGGTGNTAGSAASANQADKLSTARTFVTNLGSTAPTLFDGTASNSHGVTGVLPISNGGTGGSTQATARAGIGAAASAGVIDASSATAGTIGEYLTSQTLAQALVSGAATNVAALNLTAGDWDVSGLVRFNSTGATYTAVVAGLTATSGVQAGFPDTAQISGSLAGAAQSLVVPTKRVNISVSTIIYIVAVGYFPAGTTTTDGFIRARRIR